MGFFDELVEEYDKLEVKIYPPRVPDGKYIARFDDYELTDGEYGKVMWWHFTVVDGEYEGYSIRKPTYLSQGEKVLARFKKDLSILGLTAKGKDIENELPKFKGTTLLLETRTNGKTQYVNIFEKVSLARIKEKQAVKSEPEFGF